jgi:hypothetical protein
MSERQPLTQWICDTCGEPVGIQSGWLEWLDGRDWRTGAKRGPHSFHIVHNRKRCFQNDGRDECSDNHLQYFLGPSGLAYLLSIIDPEIGDGPPADMAEYLEVFRRLQIPFYEEARPRLVEETRAEGRCYSMTTPEYCEQVAREGRRAD